MVDYRQLQQVVELRAHFPFFPTSWFFGDFFPSFGALGFQIFETSC